jgi:hypothetical protein
MAASTGLASTPGAGGKAKSRRKQEGAVYTPAFITRYLVEQALGGVLKSRFEALRQQHEAEATGTARKALADPNAYDLTALNERKHKLGYACAGAVGRALWRRQGLGGLRRVFCLLRISACKTIRFHVWMRRPS